MEGKQEILVSTETINELISKVQVHLKSVLNQSATSSQSVGTINITAPCEGNMEYSQSSVLQLIVDDLASVISKFAAQTTEYNYYIGKQGSDQEQENKDLISGAIKSLGDAIKDALQGLGLGVGIALILVPILIIVLIVIVFKLIGGIGGSKKNIQYLPAPPAK